VFNISVQILSNFEPSSNMSQDSHPWQCRTQGYRRHRSLISLFVVVNQRLELKSSYEIQRHLKKHIVWRTVLIELYTALRIQPSLLKTIINIPQCQLQVMENQCRSIH